MSKKALEESIGFVTEKWQKTLLENRVLKQRAKMHHEQNKELMDSQDQFYAELVQQLYDARNVESSEKIQQFERERAAQSEGSLSSVEEGLRRAEEILKSSQLQDKEKEEFVNERDMLVKAKEERLLDLKRRYWEEEMALKKEFDEEFDKVMEKYSA